MTESPAGAAHPQANLGEMLWNGSCIIRNPLLCMSVVFDSDLAKFRAVSLLKFLHFTKRDYQGNSTFKWSLFFFSFFFTRRKQFFFPKPKPLKILPCCNDLEKKKDLFTSIAGSLLSNAQKLMLNFWQYCRETLTKFEEKRVTGKNLRYDSASLKIFYIYL